MSVTPQWRSAVTPGFDSQQQYLQVSQGASASISSTTVYNPQNLQTEGYLPKQFSTVEGHQLQSQLIQPPFHVTQPQNITPTTQNPQFVSQVTSWDGQYFEPHLPSTEVVELHQPGAESLATYQPQQASSMAGVYYTPQQQLVPPQVYGAQETTFMVQNSDSQQQSKQLTPVAYNLPQQSSWLSHEKGQTVTANTSNPQSVLNKLIGHEPCIHTLNYLEAQIESHVQIGKSQGEQIKVLLEQTNNQKEELKRLKQDCSSKDTTIEALRKQIDETQKAEVPGLLAIIKEQREELEKLYEGSNHGQVKGHKKVGGHVYPHERPLDCQLAGKNYEDSLGDMVSKLNLNQRELRRLQDENQAFRLDIGRLERENSELSRLRVDVIELKRRLGETRPLQKTPVVPGQSVSSTALGEQEVVLADCDQIAFSRTK